MSKTSRALKKAVLSAATLMGMKVPRRRTSLLSDKDRDTAFRLFDIPEAFWEKGSGTASLEGMIVRKKTSVTLVLGQEQVKNGRAILMTTAELLVMPRFLRIMFATPNEIISHAWDRTTDCFMLIDHIKTAAASWQDKNNTEIRYVIDPSDPKTTDEEKEWMTAQKKRLLALRTLTRKL